MKAVKLRTEHGVRACLLGDPGRLYTSYVTIDFPIRKHRIANGDVDRFTRPLTIGHKKRERPYPVTKLVNHLIRIGRAHGITKGARRLVMIAKS